MDNQSENLEDVEVIYLDELESETVEMLDNMYFNSNHHQIADTDTDLSKVTFTKHTNSVFCGDLSGNGQLAATGGEDDKGYLWSTATGDLILECTGHKDSVNVVCFNYNSQLLATGDMAGMVQVWNIQDRKLMWCNQGDDMEWLIWHPLTNILLAGGQSGEVFMWQIPQGNCKILTSHGSSSTCGKLLSDGQHLLVGYEDGQLKLWNLKTSNVKWHFVDSQISNITSIAINLDNTLCSVAPSSNLLKMSDGKSIGKLLIGDETDIEAHMFSNELNVLITGSLTGQLCIWDLSRRVIRHQVKLEWGVTVVKLGLNGTVLVGATDGGVYVCDIKTGVLRETLLGHKAGILSLCVSCDGDLMLTTSDDKTAKIFATEL